MLSSKVTEIKNIILIFEQGMQQMLKTSMECDYQENVLILKKAARIVHDDIFSSNRFNEKQEPVPMTLKLLVTMLLGGADIVDQDSADSQAYLYSTDHSL